MSGGGFAPTTQTVVIPLSFGRIWVGLWSVRKDYGLLSDYGLFGASMGVAVGSPGWPKKGVLRPKKARNLEKPVIPTPLTTGLFKRSKSTQLIFYRQMR